MYKSIIVLANPSSVIDMRFAPKEIREKVVKVDGLINYIRGLHNVSTTRNMSDKRMKELAEFFLQKNIVNENDYTEKYRNKISETQAAEEIIEKCAEQSGAEITEALPNIEEVHLYKALKEYRLKKSKEEGVKPYVLYNNSQLEEIVKNVPKTIEELKSINGFGDIRCSKYGEDILKIISENNS
jgi:superfamily II DNA helicase RecQ